jgi:hypothetical protein
MGEITCSLLEFVAYSTEELILYAVTLGKHKPRLPHQEKELMITRELLGALGTWMGVIFWCAVLTLIAWLVSK